MVAPLIAAGANAARVGAARGAVGANTGRAAALRSGTPSARTGSSAPTPEASKAFSDLAEAVLAPKWPVSVGNGSAFFLALIAISGDGLQMALMFFNAIPVAGNAISFIGSFIVGVTAMIIIRGIFMVHGVQVFSGKRAIQKAAAALGPLTLEMVPLVSSIPALTSGMLSTFIISRLEDKERYQKQQAVLAHARVMEAEWRNAQMQQAQRVGMQQAMQASAIAQSEEQEQNMNESQGYAGGEAGPAPNTLVIPKKRRAIPHEVPTELPLPDPIALAQKKPTLTPSTWQ